MASNVFFDWVASAARFARGTTVRADAVNAVFDSVTAGFDKLPTEDQLNRGTRNYIDTDTGAADVYAGSLSHVTGSYADGQAIDILIANTNLTITPTLNVSAIGATIIKTPGANSVAIGVLAQNSIASLKYNNTLSHWELLGVYDITNTVSAFMATMLDDATATEALATLGLVVTPYAKTILDDANAAEVLTTLSITAYAQTLLDDVNALAARTTLGLQGSPILLETQTHTSGVATVDFTSNIDSTYDHYFVEFHNLVPATSATELWLRVQAAAAWQASADYTYTQDDAVADTGVAQDQVVLTLATVPMTDVPALGAGHGRLDFYNYDSGDGSHASFSCDMNYPNTYIKSSRTAGVYLTAEAVTGFRLMMSSGNIKGTFKLYGVPK